MVILLPKPAQDTASLLLEPVSHPAAGCPGLVSVSCDVKCTGSPPSSAPMGLLWCRQSLGPPGLRENACFCGLSTFAPKGLFVLLSFSPLMLH